jgi:Na+-exporting ATPase
MIVKKAWVIAEGTYSVGDTSKPLDPGDAKVAFSKTSPKEDRATGSADPDYTDPMAFSSSSSLVSFLQIASFCNLAALLPSRDNPGEWNARGEPTEIAIQVFTSRFAWNRHEILHKKDGSWRPLAEYPFDSNLKRMAVVYAHTPDDSGSNTLNLVFVKGAVERGRYHVRRTGLARH